MDEKCRHQSVTLWVLQSAAVITSPNTIYLPDAWRLKKGPHYHTHPNMADTGARRSCACRAAPATATEGCGMRAALGGSPPLSAGDARCSATTALRSQARALSARLLQRKRLRRGRGWMRPAHLCPASAGARRQPLAERRPCHASALAPLLLLKLALEVVYTSRAGDEGMNEFFFLPLVVGNERISTARVKKKRIKKKKKEEKAHRTSVQPTAEFKHMRVHAIVSRGAGSLLAEPQESGLREQGIPLRSSPGGTDSERARPTLPPPTAAPAAGAAPRGPYARRAPPPYLLRPPPAVGRSRVLARGSERDYASEGLSGGQTATARTRAQPWLRRRRLKTDIKAAGGEEGGRVVAGRGSRTS